MQLTSQKGLTFVELAICLIIIGLLIIAVLAGKSLIRSAHILSLISDEHKYVSAVNVFKLKYRYFPGDYPQAASVWGANTPGCGGGGDFSSCTGTANGDGNGYIQGPEMILAWNQLALAGLISGKYAGMGINQQYSLLNTWGAVESNLPTTALSHVYPMIWYEGDPRQQQDQGDPNDMHGFYLSGNAGNVIVFGTPLYLDLSNSSAFTNLPSMYVADASTIDVKLDDGVPATGSIQTLNWGSNCANSATPFNFSTYAYNFSNTSQIGCALAFINAFE
jgi:hypothetical protein